MSVKVVKNGHVHGQAVFKCKNCSHRFYNNQQPSKMRIKKHVIVAAMNLYFDGLSVRKTQNQLRQLIGEEVDASTIYRWLVKYSSLVSKYCEENMNPETSKKWHEDETVIKCEGRNVWFWEMIDEETKFLVGSHLGGERSSEETMKIFQNANRITKERPRVIFVDGSNSYDKAFNSVYYTRVKAARVELVKRAGVRARTTNNVVERLHGTLKDRLRPMRGLKNEKASKILLDGYVVNYNYVRVHQTIKVTPAQAAGLKITNGWSELIDKATQDQALEHAEQKGEEQVIEVRA